MFNEASTTIAPRPIILLTDLLDLRCLREALETHIDTMHGGIVRSPYLTLHARIENLIYQRQNEVLDANRK